MKSFSISFQEESFDEGRFARVVAKRLGTEHFDEAFKASDVPIIVKQIADKLDEPFSDPSLLPTYKVSALARKYVKVALSGDGGDELFGGYPTYKGHLIAEALKFVPKGLVASGVYLLGLLPTSFENYPKATLAGILGRALKMPPLERQIYMMRTFFLGDALLMKKPNLSSVQKLLPDLQNVKSPSLKAQAIDFYTYLRDDFLFKTDRASMYNSLEVRVPYLDNDVIDFAFSTKAKHVDLLKTKILLRDLAREYIPEIARRPKKGFGIPTAKWLRGPLKDFGYGYIQNKKLDGFVERKKIQKLWQEHQNMTKNNGGVLWMLVMLSSWLDNWV
jgi:asparagine synthase (glutamine-hydrolysing)